MFNSKFKINMSSFHIEMIQQAFSRCFGLKDSILKGVKENDDLLLKASIDSLARQTGFRESFLEENLYQIVSL